MVLIQAISRGLGFGLYGHTDGSEAVITTGFD